MAGQNYECDDKMVSHPGHYQSNTGLEVIDAVEAFTEGLEGIEACDTGNIIKYICRWKKKNGIQDLKKAQWYLQHLINHVEGLGEDIPNGSSFKPGDLISVTTCNGSVYHGRLIKNTPASIYVENIDTSMMIQIYRTNIVGITNYNKEGEKDS